MKKQLIILITCLVVSVQAFSDSCGYNCCNDCFGFESALTFDVGGGYRNDSLKWKRYLPNSTEVIQKKWNNIGMGIVEANASFLACEHFLFKADFDYGWFNNSGHQRYNAYDNDVLTESFKSRTSGNVYDLSGGVGYQFNFDCYRIVLAPLVGYSYDYQKFKNKKYEDELVEDEASTVFKNSYHYRWRGPWIGVAFAYQPCCDVLVFFDYSFHWSRVKAKVNEQFVPEERSVCFKVNQAYGNEFTVGANYLFCDNWFLGVKFDYKNFWGNKGKFHSRHEEEHDRVRKLSWISYNVTLDIGYTF